LITGQKLLSPCPAKCSYKFLFAMRGKEKRPGTLTLFIPGPANGEKSHSRNKVTNELM